MAIKSRWCVEGVPINFALQSQSQAINEVRFNPHKNYHIQICLFPLSHGHVLPSYQTYMAHVLSSYPPFMTAILNTPNESLIVS